MQNYLPPDRLYYWASEFLRIWETVPLPNDEVDQGLEFWSPLGYGRDPHLSDVPQEAFTQILLGKYQGLGTESEELTLTWNAYLEGAEFIRSLLGHGEYGIKSLFAVEMLYSSGVAGYEPAFMAFKAYLIEVISTTEDEFMRTRHTAYLSRMEEVEANRQF